MREVGQPVRSVAGGSEWPHDGRLPQDLGDNQRECAPGERTRGGFADKESTNPIEQTHQLVVHNMPSVVGRTSGLSGGTVYIREQV